MQTRLVTQVIAAALSRLLLNTARRFVYPFAPALSRGLDVPLTAITAIIATSQLTALLGAVSGFYADRLGNRFMMRAGLSMLALGMLMCGIADNYWPVFLGLVIASFGKTVFDPAILAFIGSTIPFDRRGRVIGIVETAWAGSTLVGIPALALIIEHGGLPASFYLMAVLGAVSWFAIGRCIPVDRTATVPRLRPSIWGALRELCGMRPAAGMLAFGFWISVANDCLFVVYGAWFEQEFMVSIVTLGFSTVAIGSAELLGESLTALFGDRLGLKRATILGLCLAITAYLFLPLAAHSFTLAMAGIFFVFLAYEFTIVTSFSLSTELLPEARATMMGGFYATAGLGRMLGVLLGGVLWQWGGIMAISWSAAGLTALGLFSLVWGLRGWRPA